MGMYNSGTIDIGAGSDWGMPIDNSSSGRVRIERNARLFGQVFSGDKQSVDAIKRLGAKASKQGNGYEFTGSFSINKDWLKAGEVSSDSSACDCDFGPIYIDYLESKKSLLETGLLHDDNLEVRQALSRLQSAMKDFDSEKNTDKLKLLTSINNLYRTVLDKTANGDSVTKELEELSKIAESLRKEAKMPALRLVGMAMIALSAALSLWVLSISIGLVAPVAPILMSPLALKISIGFAAGASAAAGAWLIYNTPATDPLAENMISINADLAKIKPKL